MAVQIDTAIDIRENSSVAIPSGSLKTEMLLISRLTSSPLLPCCLPHADPSGCQAEMPRCGLWPDSLCVCFCVPITKSSDLLQHNKNQCFTKFDPEDMLKFISLF